MYFALKRGFDFLVAVVALTVLLPAIFLIALLIWRHDRGPIFYRARRVGRFGVPFTMLKFRTMVLDAEKLGSSSTADDDPRITRVGKFLRQHKLDELPQLFNVIAGSMSLVGPRPQVQWAVDLYSDEERQVLQVPPGITDYASLYFPNEGEILKGSKDPDRDYMEKIHPIKMQLAIAYSRRRSLLTDIAILFRTAATPFGSRAPLVKSV